MIDVNEIVYIHIIGSEDQVDSLKSEFKTDALNDVNIHYLSDLQKRLGLEALSGKFSDGMMTWLCSKQHAFQSHYGEVKDYSQYYYLLTAKALKAASILLVLSAMLIAESNISSVIEHERSMELLDEQAEEYKKIYKKRFEEYESVFKNARSMNAVVDMADQIAQHGKASPLDFMIEVSEVLSQSNLAIEHIDKIEWSLEQYKDLGDSQEVYVDNVDVTREDPVRHIGVLYGRIAISDKNYRSSVTQINRIINVLKKHERVERVEAIEMPVEIRSDRIFNDESGLNTQLLRREAKGKFALEIVMRSVTHE